MKSQSRFLEISLAGLTVIAACATAAVACSNTDSGDDSAAAGTGGASTSNGGTATSSAGAVATAGASTSGGGAGGTGAVAMGTACPKAMSATISDFTALDGGGGDPSAFGDFTTTFSGSTYVYPNGAANFPLVADFSQENWHITGTVGDFSGFGLVFSLASSATGGCNLVDASMFSGISFSIKGSVPIAGALANSVQFTVGTAADDVAASWLDAHKATPTTADATPSFGTCMPVSNQYDGTCGSPSLKIPVTDTATVINVKWTDLIGGKPMASPDPTKITFI
ncbi:MAG TPA: hypothetical protein VK745_26430, partial [Polyangiaceae bacterium]|nr:hypothetical protein [Polyangiaceae bacterium]